MTKPRIAPQAVFCISGQPSAAPLSPLVLCAPGPEGRRGCRYHFSGSRSGAGVPVLGLCPQGPPPFPVPIQALPLLIYGPQQPFLKEVILDATSMPEVINWRGLPPLLSNSPNKWMMQRMEPQSMLARVSMFLTAPLEVHI